MNRKSNILKQCLSLTIFMLFGMVSYSQLIFDEPFDEPADATTGVDDVGGFSWVTFCPECVGDGDYFKVVDGALEGQDTNGPAFVETNVIDISSLSLIHI